MFLKAGLAHLDNTSFPKLLCTETPNTGLEEHTSKAAMSTHFSHAFAPWKPSPDPLRSLMKQSKLLLKRSKRLNVWFPKETKVLKRLQVNYFSLYCSKFLKTYLSFSKAAAALARTLLVSPGS